MPRGVVVMGHKLKSTEGQGIDHWLIKINVGGSADKKLAFLSLGPQVQTSVNGQCWPVKHYYSTYNYYRLLKTKGAIRY